jgi:FkbM family methyltransferase
MCSRNTQYAFLGGSLGLTKVLSKYRMYVDTRDTSLVPHFIMDGYWEPWITIALRGLKGGTAIDIGANHGYYTLLLAELCGKVYAFEPQPDICDLLRKNVIINGFRQDVDVYAYAVGAERGLAYLEEAEDGAKGSARIFGEVDFRGEKTVDVISLDEMFPSEEDISFIKMDAEGSEEAIWKGMQNLLKSSHPTILMEFTPEAYQDADGFLADIQKWYPLREVDNDGELATVSPEEILGRDLSMLWLEKEK